MITPVMIQFAFWLVVLCSVIFAVRDFIHAQYFLGIQILILGPLLSRIMTELLLLGFKIFQTLRNIEDAVTKSE